MSKKKPIDVPELRRLIRLLSDKADDMGPPPEWRDTTARVAWTAKLDAFFADLQVFENACYRSASDGASLRMAGVRSSCTAGPIGLLHNWIAAAERKIMDAWGEPS